MDFGLLPPEVNSARMYAGAGPGPLLAAAGAWDELAGELGSAASAYESQICGLSGVWSGPSAEAMAGAAEPFVAWLSATAASAEQAGVQARAAVAAYEAAFAATVPPPTIAANRSLLATLVATNFLGQNTAAIAATEFHYAAMWAQDAAAMYGYAGAAASASVLTSFSAPPATTNDNADAALSEVTSVVPNTLRGLATTVTSTPKTAGSAAGTTAGTLQSMLSSISTIAANLTGPYSPVGLTAIPGAWWLTGTQVLGLAQNVPGVTALLAGKAPITGALGPLSGGYMSLQTPTLAAAGSGGGSVSAVLARAGTIGSLSVPAGWASTAPTVSTAATTLPATGVTPAIVAGSQSGLFTDTALSSLAGRGVAGTAAHSVRATRVVGTTAIATDDDDTTVNIIVIHTDPETE